jgi:tetratricopeptide (TPR) repeat protein
MKNRRFIFLGLTLLAAGATLLALRVDLSRWQIARGDRFFRSGDLHGALEAWSSPLITPSSRTQALIGRGAAHYRLGELAKATSDFKAAATSSDADLRQQALYNLGTTLLATEQTQRSAKQGDHERLLTEAVQQLQTATELNPADAAAKHNRGVAQARLTALLRGQAGAKTSRQSQENNPEKSDRLKKPGQAGTQGGQPGAATELDSSAGRRRAAPAMTSEQALRMLDDARGREALRSGVAAGNRQEKLSPPEKDW